MMKLESEKPNIQADLEAGKRLQKEKNAPVFVAQQVSELDKKWKDTNEKAKAKHEKLKVNKVCCIWTAGHLESSTVSSCIYDLQNLCKMCTGNPKIDNTN